MAQPSLRTTSGQPPTRKDVLALWGGIAFSFAFTGLIWAFGYRLDTIPLAPDTGFSHYYWKLTEPTFWTRLSVWGLYAAHQLTIWGLIYYAQTRVKTYTSGLHPVNIWALGANAVFIVLHFIQTHVFYDGLAQDVSILSSQGSVILLLVFIMMMENQRRGMFFGAKAPLASYLTDFIRKYHGYFFAWAIIYTFWYHPMVATMGHLIGFAYTFLLMLQGSLFLTRIHLNKYWTFAQEAMVLLHGTLVAVQQGNGIWPMFAFGFGGIFVITQMYGLGLSKLTRWALLASYCVLALWVYSQRGFDKLNEIIRIPLIDYVLVFTLALLIGGPMWLMRRFRRPPMQAAGD